jgi:hypothetical protein
MATLYSLTARKPEGRTDRDRQFSLDLIQVVVLGMSGLAFDFIQVGLGDVCFSFDFIQ